MATLYKLALDGGVNQSLADWGLSRDEWSVDKGAQSQVTPEGEKMTLVQPVQSVVSATPLFSFGDWLTLRRSDDSGATWVPLFRGMCLDPEYSGSGANQRIVYSVVGPWWHLGPRGLVYQQPWFSALSTAGDEVTIYTADVLLGLRQYGIAWTRMCTGAMLHNSIPLTDSSGHAVNRAAHLSSSGAAYGSAGRVNGGSAVGAGGGDSPTNTIFGTGVLDWVLQRIPGLFQLDATDFSATIDATGLPTAGGDLYMAALFPPYVNARSQECLSLVSAILQYHVDIALYFDYSTEVAGVCVPTLHAKRVSNLPSKTLAWGSGCAASLKARTDLVPDCVSIDFKQTGSVAGTPRIQFYRDTYPASVAVSAGNPDGDPTLAPAASIHLIDIAGAKFDVEQAESVLAALPADVYAATPGATAVAWWMARHEALNSLWKDGYIDPATVSVKQATCYSDGDVATAWATLTSSSLFHDGSLWEFAKPNSIPKWFPNHGLSGTAVLTAYKISAQLTATVYKDAARTQLSVLNGRFPIATKLYLTDAASGVQTHLNLTSAGDGIPPGLAQALYTAWNIAWQEGSVQVFPDANGAVPSSVLSAGIKLTISGGRGAWSGMNVRSIHLEPGFGKAILAVGPPPHASPQSLVRLLSLFRHRMIYGNPATVLDGGSL